eukprot:gene36420-biopygen28466
MPHTLGIKADDTDTNRAIGAASGTGHLAVKPGLARDERGATADKRGFEEIFARPGFHKTDVFLGMELKADYVAA